uniref:Uncharacterized protein n=1 Tax=Timema genevievae TaxID=629358 RepID=A0A7R9JRA3_TIMGE|nr:unnamed protein product [Timema genevievae]
MSSCDIREDREIERERGEPPTVPWTGIRTPSPVDCAVQSFVSDTLDQLATERVSCLSFATDLTSARVQPNFYQAVQALRHTTRSREIRIEKERLSWTHWEFPCAPLP